MHGIMYIGRSGMLKVRNYNLRGSENEMTKKVLNFIEKRKKKEWLASSTTKAMNGSVHGC